MIIAGRLRWDSSPWLTGSVVLGLVIAAAIAGWFGARETGRDDKAVVAVPDGLAATVRLVGVDLTGEQLPEVTLVRADLTGATLRRTELTGANLRGATLTGADLAGANLTSADLTSALLAGANLRQATLVGTCLRGADLRSTDLSHARFTAADLRGANLHGASMQGATFIDARGDATAPWSKQPAATGKTRTAEAAC